MDLFFADDARQNRPSRAGMGPLVATGGIYVPAKSVRNLERVLDNLCTDCGFPPREQFKWSPGRELWMHDHLTEERRDNFFVQALRLAVKKDAKAIIIIEDTRFKTATGAATPELDVTQMLIERVHNLLEQLDSEALIIVDRPSGDRREEDKFLANCVDTLQNGTVYVRPERIALNVLSAPSKFHRLLQLADVVTSCSLAFVAGENRFAPRIFDAVKRLLDRGVGRVGGIALKIHPDLRYANLYGWLLGDSDFTRHGVIYSLPAKNFPYATSPDSP
ncbi:MAG TPA: DUF3800 domain-containing protein [Firmicutes bacterium]|nr:DUF3800 domain-containing protein [Bacillota bacterium]